MDDVAVETENLSYAYPNGTLGLRDVTVILERGRLISIMGPNGSGKSTFVKHLNGLLRPTKGSVRVYGMDTREYSVAELSRKVGLVFQNPDHQLFARTVLQELEFGPKNLGLGAQRVAEMSKRTLIMTGLWDLRERDPRSLSFGQRQKVAVASVLSMDPDILVLDEPTTGQDQFQCNAIVELSMDLCRMGKTVLMVTHDAELVAEHSDSVLIFAGGRLLAHKDPRWIFYRRDLLDSASLTPPQLVELAQRLSPSGTLPNPIKLDEVLTILVEARQGVVSLS